MKLWRPWTQQDEIELREALAEGVSLQRLMIRMKRSESTFIDRTLGLTIKPVTRAARGERI